MDDARVFVCARCRRQVLICSRCDRGQQYCGARCSALARAESLRAAGRRYQQSRRGRHCHAERQRRYRHRCREGAWQEKVTHHGSASPPLWWCTGASSSSDAWGEPVDVRQTGHRDALPLLRTPGQRVRACSLAARRSFRHGVIEAITGRRYTGAPARGTDRRARWRSTTMSRRQLRKTVDRKRGERLRHVFLNFNFPFAPEEYPHDELPSRSSSQYPVLWRFIIEPLEQAPHSDAATRAAELYRWVLENIQLPPELKARLCEAEAKRQA